MNRTEIIQAIINQNKGKVYLEIGVAQGDTFFSIQARRKIGVDPAFAISRLRRWLCNNRIISALSMILIGKGQTFFEMTSDNFFSNKSKLFINNKIDVALIDGAHSYKQALKDVRNCLSNLNENGIIVMHDCNPVSEVMAYPASSKDDARKAVFKSGLKGWSGAWSGDVWKTIVYLKSCRDDLSVFVLDCDCGIGIVSRGAPENRLYYSPEDIDQMSYSDLEKRRETLLSLKRPEYLWDFLKRKKGHDE